MMPFARALAGPFLAAIILAACGGGNAASKLVQAPDFQPKDQAKCSVEKSKARPLIVEWPPADRLALEAQMKGGLIAVRYTGCEMELLPACRIAGKYTYVPATRQDEQITMRDADDLYANMPAHAAELEAKLARSGRLDVKMSMVGTYHAETRPDAPPTDPACAGATHVVLALTAGAFEMSAGADAQVAGGVSIGGLGAGANSESSRETLGRGGDPNACAGAKPGDAAPPFNCGALLRLEVGKLPTLGDVPTRCETVLSDEGCPSNPSIKGTFPDDWDGSGRDQARCMKRAADWFSYCASSKPVVTRFYRGAIVAQEQTYAPATRCQIVLPAEGCRRHPWDGGRSSTNDAYENANADVDRCMVRATDWFYACNDTQPVTARFFDSGQVVRETKAQPTTRCEITLGPDGCVGVPTLDPVFNDYYEASATDEGRCMKRAREYLNFCGSTGPVTARFFNASGQTKIERAQSPSHCQVTFPAEGCRRHPLGLTSVINDEAENSGADETRCLRRARDFYYYCDATQPMTARYFEGANVTREVTAHPATKCEITLPPGGCPTNKSVSGTFNDDYENAGEDGARCMRRAAEWKTACALGAPVRGRLMRGEVVVQETTVK
jgi:hypothetical protein